MVLEKIFGTKWPTPVAKPMAPFFIAGAIVFYGVNSLAGFLGSTEEFKNDPRNPMLRKAGAGTGGH